MFRNMWIWIIIVMIVYGLNFFYAIHPDEQVFFQIAEQIGQGKALYVDMVDYKPPGIYFVWYLANSFWLLVSQVELSAKSSALMARGIVLVANLISAYSIYKISNLPRFTPRRFLSPVLFLIILTYYQGQFAITEPFMAMWLVMGTYFLINYFISKVTPPNLPFNRGGMSLFLSGLCFGTAILFKQPALLNILAVMIWLLCKGTPCTRARSPLKQITNFLAGAVIPWIPVLIYFHLHQALPHLWHSLFVFPFTSYPPLWIETVLELPNLIWPLVTAVIVVRFFYEPHVARQDRIDKNPVPQSRKSARQIFNFNLLIMLFILLPVPLILTRPYHHYWLQILPFYILYAVEH